MRRIARARDRSRPETGELVSLSERMGSLGIMRLGFGVAVLVVGALAPDLRGVSVDALVLATGAFLSSLAVPTVVRRLPRGPALLACGATLLLDGVYLAWVTYATGGVQSPLRFLLYVHVVAVTLVGSYRTGLKVAAWNSLMLLVVLYAQSAGILEPTDTLVSALPGEGEHFQLFAILNVAALWAVALGTAAFSAVNERELRSQKIDLDELSSMVREIDARADTSEIPHILLNKLCEVFGFTRGAVLASPQGDLELMAYRGTGEAPHVEPGLDPVMEAAWNKRLTQLVKQVDPDVDRRLATLFPGARHLLVVPLFLDRGQRLGILAVEHPGKAPRIKRWVVTVVEQFASHAALALQNAWLLDEVQRRLEENRALQQELVARNLSLEARVGERTRELSESLRNLRQVDDERRKLLARLVSAQEEERQRIAGDIHDDPVQKIVAAGMRLQLLRKQVTEPELRKILDKLLETIGASIVSLRHLIFELRPSVLDQDGLAPALREYLHKLADDLEFDVDNRLSEEPPGETRVLLYRIAQEALANVRKHAQASKVAVVLREQDGGYLVRISDDGVGFSPQDGFRSAPGHLGLSSMRERAEMAGGWCKVHSLLGGGTTVEFWVPPGPASAQGAGAVEEADEAFNGSRFREVGSRT
ncbi:MAG: GAF domain-containing sensor histidine kinase [Actinomycetota bacterium]